MFAALPKLRVGDALRHESLSVFPLFSDAQSDVEYRLSDAALAEKTLFVEEVSEGGSVPELLVENKGDLRVLFLEGEELVGAKQNRVLNTSVLIPAHARIKIPVWCVERGRWGYKSKFFGSSGSHSPYKVRHALKSSVSQSIKERRGHTSDQGEVWKQVSALHSTHGVDSTTHAMSDAFDMHQDSIAAFREKLNYVEGATGIAVAIGERVISVDLFDKPGTCEKVWNRLLTGVVFDALEAGKTDKCVSVSEVEQLLAIASDLPWEASQAVGEGEEYRAESQKGDHASALAFEDTVVHGSVVTAV